MFFLFLSFFFFLVTNKEITHQNVGPDFEKTPVVGIRVKRLRAKKEKKQKNERIEADQPALWLPTHRPSSICLFD